VRLLAVVAGVLALLGAACSSGGGGDDGEIDDGGATDAASIDACALLSDAEAAEVLGGPAEAGPGTGPGESVCTWSGEAGKTITIAVGSEGTAPGDEFDPARVNGLGTADEVEDPAGAFYVGIGTVAFASGERLHTVQVATGATADVDRAKAEELAPLVHERIEQS
jgi:hypothetical protein